MYRLLIVDDEPIILDGLYNLLQESGHLDLDICRACSGDEALETLSRIYVDVVISDIKMPGINGLQLLDIIMQRWPDCRVIMLSGYDEFSYIYKAVQHKGVSYLLKTEGDQRILDAVENCLQDIERSNRTRELLAKSEDMLKTMLPELQREFFSGMLRCEPVEWMPKRFEELKIPLHADSPVLMLLGSFRRPAAAGMSGVAETGFRMKLELEQSLGDSIRSVSIPLGGNAMLWLMQPVESAAMNKWEKMASNEEAGLHVRRMLEKVQNFLRETMDLHVSFAMYREPVMWDEVAEKYARLDYLLRSKLETDAEFLITDAGASTIGQDVRTRSAWAARSFDHVFLQFDALETYLENGSRNEFHSLFSKMQAQLRELCCGDYPLSFEAYSRISLFFISYVNRIGVMESLSPEAEISRLFHTDLLGTWDEAFGIFNRIADSIFEICGLESRKRAEAAILKIRKYVEEHLSGDLSLASLGDQVYFNPKYLSKMFKQVTGSNYLSYINDLKLSRVKELLNMNDTKISEIGAQVGFLSAPYFTRFFKKATGMTPQEYRSRIIANKVEKG